MNKQIVITLTLFFWIPTLQGMNDFFKKAGEKINGALDTIKQHVNPEYGRSCRRIEVQRSGLFRELRENYRGSGAPEISKKDILGLKSNLEDKNKKSVIEICDVLNCLRNYNEIYEQLRNDDNNSYFIDTILPVLLKNYSFPNDNANAGLGKFSYIYTKFTFARDNVYLMRTLIFHHQLLSKVHLHERVSIMLSSDSQTEGYQSVEVYQLNEEAQIEYLKDIVTPPASWLHDIKKDIISTLYCFLTCLKVVKNKPETPRPAIYKLPKPVLFQYILRTLIKGSITQEAESACPRILDAITPAVELIKRFEALGKLRLELLKKEETPSLIPSFLEKKFKAWARETINPENFLYKEITRKKN